jgi:PAS domain S-box-containing protein
MHDSENAGTSPLPAGTSPLPSAPADTAAGSQAQHTGAQLLNGIVDATHQLISSHHPGEDEILASLEILRRSARADRICVQMTSGEPLDTDVPLDTRCVGLEGRAWPLPARWQRIFSSHIHIHAAVADLPASEAEVLTKDRIQRVLAFPIIADGILRGQLRLDRTGTSEAWRVPEIAVLQIATYGCGGALAYIEAQTALQESEARFRRLVENAPDLIYRMSLHDGKYEYVSPSAKTILGVDPATLIERPLMIRELIHPGWRGYFDTAWENLLRGEVPPTYEYAIIHRETGATRWCYQRNVPIRNASGEVVAIEGIVTDITARKRAELKLKTQQSLLESVFRAAPIGIAVVSARMILHVNDRVCEITGYTCDELVGSTARKFYPSEEDYDYVGRVGYGMLQETGVSSVRTRWLRKDGTIINVLLRAAALDEQDLNAGVTVTVMPIEP